MVLFIVSAQNLTLLLLTWAKQDQDPQLGIWVIEKLNYPLELKELKKVV